MLSARYRIAFARDWMSITNARSIAGAKRYCNMKISWADSLIADQPRVIALLNEMLRASEGYSRFTLWPVAEIALVRSPNPAEDWTRAKAVATAVGFVKVLAAAMRS